jgi:hypothetical protein
MATTKPARSDPHLPPEEAARVEAGVRGYFDSVAPRRPAKPPRSDPSEGAAAEAGAGDGDLPELRKLQDIAADPQVSALLTRLLGVFGGWNCSIDVSVAPWCRVQKLVLDGAGDLDGGEEYIETRYYDGLNCIDKQHHTVSFAVPGIRPLIVIFVYTNFVNLRRDIICAVLKLPM